MKRRELFAFPGALALAAQVPAQGGITRYARYWKDGAASYGVVEGQKVRELKGGIFGKLEFTGKSHDVAGIRYLQPCQPTKVWAVGLNYRSHLGNRPAPKNPEIFLKPTTCLQEPGGPIIIPPDAHNVHYEAELVVVIGKRLRNATLEEAKAGIFGYTCGNDVSERDWQNNDLQWWRAKGADTFGPFGPLIVGNGFDPAGASIQCRLNGEVKQKQKLSDLLFDCPAIVQFISRYATLDVGDVIFTGTPGSTTAMKPGDVVEVEIEGIGVLKNPVLAA